MIFLEGDKNKKILLFFLVSIFMIFIIFQWIENGPLNKTSSDKSGNEYWDQFDEVFSATGKTIESNLEQGEQEIDDFQDEQDREYKQNLLLENTKEYLENKKQATSSKATSTDS